MTLIEKIKLLFKARKPIEDLVSKAKGFKSGYKTVAFWVAILASLGGLFAALQGFIPAGAFLVGSTIIAMLYNIARGFEKSDQQGVRPTLQSTEFWFGVGTIILQSIASLQAGGIKPEWLVTANTIIGGSMAMAQNLGAQQPTAAKQ